MLVLPTSCYNTSSEAGQQCNKLYDGLYGASYWGTAKANIPVGIFFYFDQSYNFTSFDIFAWWQNTSTVCINNFTFYVSTDNISYTPCMNITEQCDSNVDNAWNLYNVNSSCIGKTIKLNITQGTTLAAWGTRAQEIWFHASSPTDNTIGFNFSNITSLVNTDSILQTINTTITSNTTSINLTNTSVPIDVTLKFNKQTIDGNIQYIQQYQNKVMYIGTTLHLITNNTANIWFRTIDVSGVARPGTKLTFYQANPTIDNEYYLVGQVYTNEQGYSETSAGYGVYLNKEWGTVITISRDGYQQQSIMQPPFVTDNLQSTPIDIILKQDSSAYSTLMVLAPDKITDSDGSIGIEVISTPYATISYATSFQKTATTTTVSRWGAINITLNNLIHYNQSESNFTLYINETLSGKETTYSKLITITQWQYPCSCRIS